MVEKRRRATFGKAMACIGVSMLMAVSMVPSGTPAHAAAPKPAEVLTDTVALQPANALPATGEGEPLPETTAATPTTQQPVTATANEDGTYTAEGLIYKVEADKATLAGFAPDESKAIEVPEKLIVDGDEVTVTKVSFTEGQTSNVVSLTLPATIEDIDLAILNAALPALTMIDIAGQTAQEAADTSAAKAAGTATTKPATYATSGGMLFKTNTILLSGHSSTIAYHELIWAPPMLVTASIPVETSKIASGAFTGNTALDTIVVWGGVDEVAEDAFTQEQAKSVTFVVPLETKVTPAEGEDRISAKVGLSVGKDVMRNAAFAPVGFPVENATNIEQPGTTTGIVAVEEDGTITEQALEDAGSELSVVRASEKDTPKLRTSAALSLAKAAEAGEVAPPELPEAGLVFEMLPDATLSVRWEGDPSLIPAHLEIPAYAKLGSGTYPVSTIAENAFAGATNLEMVTIPETVISVGEGAFGECDHLSNINPIQTSACSKDVNMLHEMLSYSSNLTDRSQSWTGNTVTFVNSTGRDMVISGPGESTHYATEGTFVATGSSIDITFAFNFSYAGWDYNSDYGWMDFSDTTSQRPSGYMTAYFWWVDNVNKSATMPFNGRVQTGSTILTKGVNTYTSLASKTITLLPWAGNTINFVNRTGSYLRIFGPGWNTHTASEATLVAPDGTFSTVHDFSGSYVTACTTNDYSYTFVDFSTKMSQLSNSASAGVTTYFWKCDSNGSNATKFDGYFKTGNDVIPVTTRADDYCTLAGQGTVELYSATNTVTLSFNANGGNNAPSSIAAVPGTTNSFSAPTRNNWKFIGWYAGRSGSKRADNGLYTATGGAVSICTPAVNTTYYAVWAPDKLTLNYRGGKNGSSAGPDSAARTAANSTTSTFTIPNYTTLTRAECTCIGWNTSDTTTANPSITGTTYQTTTTNQTLYAIWETPEKSVDVTTDVGVTITPKTGFHGSSALTGVNGSFKSNMDTDVIINIAPLSNYEIQKVEIKSDGKMADGSAFSVSSEPDSGYAGDYSFRMPNDNVAITVSAVPKFLIFSVKSNDPDKGGIAATRNTKFSAGDSKVTWDESSGALAIDRGETKDNDIAYSVFFREVGNELYVMSKSTGGSTDAGGDWYYKFTYSVNDSNIYEFTGWTVRGNSVDSSAPIDGADANPVRANFDLASFDIKFVTRGGTAPTTTVGTHKAGTETDLSGVISSKAGYWFMGWDTSAGKNDGPANKIGAGVGSSNCNGDGEIEVYAIWAPKVYTVNYNKGKDSAMTMASSSRTYVHPTALASIYPSGTLVQPAGTDFKTDSITEAMCQNTKLAAKADITAITSGYELNGWAKCASEGDAPALGTIPTTNKWDGNSSFDADFIQAIWNDNDVSTRPNTSNAVTLYGVYASRAAGVVNLSPVGPWENTNAGGKVNDSKPVRVNNPMDGDIYGSTQQLRFWPGKGLVSTDAGPNHNGTNLPISTEVATTENKLSDAHLNLTTLYRYGYVFSGWGTQGQHDEGNTVYISYDPENGYQLTDKGWSILSAAGDGVSHDLTAVWTVKEYKVEYKAADSSADSFFEGNKDTLTDTYSVKYTDFFVKDGDAYTTAVQTERLKFASVDLAGYQRTSNWARDEKDAGVAPDFSWSSWTIQGGSVGATNTLLSLWGNDKFYTYEEQQLEATPKTGDIYNKTPHTANVYAVYTSNTMVPVSLQITDPYEEAGYDDAAPDDRDATYGRPVPAGGTPAQVQTVKYWPGKGLVANERVQTDLTANRVYAGEGTADNVDLKATSATGDPTNLGKIALSAQSIHRYGYIFEGWGENVDGTDVVYIKYNETYNGSNISLDASGNPNYTLTLTADGVNKIKDWNENEAWDTASSGSAEGGKVTVPDLDSEGNYQYDGDGKLLTKEIDAYAGRAWKAIWTEKEYEIQYELVDGANNIKNNTAGRLQKVREANVATNNNVVKATHKVSYHEAVANTQTTDATNLAAAKKGVTRLGIAENDGYKSGTNDDPSMTWTNEQTNVGTKPDPEANDWTNFSACNVMQGEGDSATVATSNMLAVLWPTDGYNKQSNLTIQSVFPVWRNKTTVTITLKNNQPVTGNAIRTSTPDAPSEFVGTQVGTVGTALDGEKVVYNHSEDTTAAPAGQDIYYWPRRGLTAEATGNNYETTYVDGVANGGHADITNSTIEINYPFRYGYEFLGWGIQGGGANGADLLYLKFDENTAHGNAGVHANAEVKTGLDKTTALTLTDEGKALLTKWKTINTDVTNNNDYVGDGKTPRLEWEAIWRIRTYEVTFKMPATVVNSLETKGDYTWVRGTDSMSSWYTATKTWNYYDTLVTPTYNKNTGYNTYDGWFLGQTVGEPNDPQKRKPDDNQHSRITENEANSQMPKGTDRAYVMARVDDLYYADAGTDTRPSGDDGAVEAAASHNNLRIYESTWGQYDSSTDYPGKPDNVITLWMRTQQIYINVDAPIGVFLSSNNKDPEDDWSKAGNTPGGAYKVGSDTRSELQATAKFTVKSTNHDLIVTNVKATDIVSGQAAKTKDAWGDDADAITNVTTVEDVNDLKKGLSHNLLIPETKHDADGDDKAKTLYSKQSSRMFWISPKDTVVYRKDNNTTSNKDTDSRRYFGYNYVTTDGIATGDNEIRGTRDATDQNNPLSDFVLMKGATVGTGLSNTLGGLECTRADEVTDPTNDNAKVTWKDYKFYYGIDFVRCKMSTSYAQQLVENNTDGTWAYNTTHKTPLVKLMFTFAVKQENRIGYSLRFGQTYDETTEPNKAAATAEVTDPFDIEVA